jgi:serine/threonine protein kinase
MQARWPENISMDDLLVCTECGVSLPAGSRHARCARCLNRLSRTVTQRPAPGVARPAHSGSVELTDFRRFAIELGLLEAGELDRFSVPDDDISRLAGALVRAGKLTNYQAAALAQGKTKGLVIGPYLILDKRGQGGMGVVFKARHRPTGQVVALKVLPPSFGRDREAVLRFRREVEIAARLDHPNIVKALDASEDRGVHFLAMEFIEGQDLDSLVSSGGPLPIELAVHCAIEAARGMQAAHAQGIIHRDIKPANLMLARSGVVQVLDLGLARVIESASPVGQSRSGALTQTGVYMGTVDFTAPEQADDARRADHRADIYSLGCTLYFLLTARPPFEGETMLKKLIAHQERAAPSLRAVRNDVPEALDQVYQAMMWKRPTDRPQSMTAVIEILEACRSGVDDVEQTRAGLTTYAARVFKRASPRRRDLERNPSVFARPTESDGLWFNPDLRLEDLITDYRPEIPFRELPEEKLPRIRPPRRRSRRGSGLAALGVITLVGIGFAGYTVTRNRAPESNLATAPLIVQPLQSPNSPTRPTERPVVASLIPSTPGRDPSGFIELFNGKDMTGWKSHPQQPGNWRVMNGILIGSGSTASHLYTERDSFADFHLRAQVRINDGGNSGVFARASFGPTWPLEKPRYPHGYEVQIYGGAVPSGNTGSLFAGAGSPVVDVREAPVPSFRWFALEVRAEGARIVVIVNGKITADYQDVKWPYRRGRIALQQLDPKTIIEFRKIEIMEIKPLALATNNRRSMSDGMTSSEASDGFVPLFNGRDTAGWSAWGEKGPLSSADAARTWWVRSGVLNGSGGLSHLFSPRGDYKDFRVRAEVKINDGGNSGIFLRVTKGPGHRPAYEAQINSTHKDPYKTGSLYRNPEPPIKVSPSPVPPDTWFTLEAEAVGGRIRIWVDGKRYVEWVDPHRTYSQGHIAIQAHNPQSLVQIRKLEVMELDPTGRPIAGLTRSGVHADGAWRPEDATEFHGKYFKVFAQQLSWHQARLRCQELGGHLAIVTSVEENRFLNSVVKQQRLDSAWLGATNEKTEGTWVCVDGTPMRFSDWDLEMKQPNNKQGLEHYLLMIVARDGKWSDQPTFSTQHHPGFVCQWDESAERR